MPDSIRRRKAAIFQALGHPTRIAILELLEAGELTAGTLLKELSRSDPAAAQANVSQHLAVLRSQQIVKTRKAGNQVFYSVRDPVIHEVLALLRRYLQTHLNELLSELETSPDLASDPEDRLQEARG
jgi:ArsR family transcriptional regulator